jgi:hypothetical protein
MGFDRSDKKAEKATCEKSPIRAILRYELLEYVANDLSDSPLKRTFTIIDNS